jgi:hypothetical protein
MHALLQNNSRILTQLSVFISYLGIQSLAWFHPQNVFQESCSNLKLPAIIVWETPTWRVSFVRPGFLCSDQFGARQRHWTASVITLATSLARDDAKTSPPKPPQSKLATKPPSLTAATTPNARTAQSHNRRYATCSGTPLCPTSN